MRLKNHKLFYLNFHVSSISWIHRKFANTGATFHEEKSIGCLFRKSHALWKLLSLSLPALAAAGRSASCFQWRT